MKLRLVYFAWVRERIGTPEEEVDLPPSVTTVSALLDWLKARDEAYAYALEDADLIRVAIDKTHATHEASLVDAREVALFPPMTGG